MHARRLLALAGALLATSAVAQDDIIAGSAPEAPASQVISLSEKGGAFTHDDQSAGDVLSPARDAVVRSVRFWGGSETSAENDTNTMGFRVRIYEFDTSSGVLALVREERHARGFAAPAETGTTFGKQGASLHQYEIELWNDLPLDGGASYLVAISAMTFLDPIASREAWAIASAPGDGEIMIDRLDGASWQIASGIAPGLAIQLVGEMEAPDCLADVNQDGVLSPTDFNAWIAAYNTGDSRADQNEDGLITPADFNAWIGNYNRGC